MMQIYIRHTHIHTYTCIRIYIYMYIYIIYIYLNLKYCTVFILFVGKGGGLTKKAWLKLHDLDKSKGLPHCDNTYHTCRRHNLNTLNNTENTKNVQMCNKYTQCSIIHHNICYVYISYYIILSYIISIH